MCLICTCRLVQIQVLSYSSHLNEHDSHLRDTYSRMLIFFEQTLSPMTIFRMQNRSFEKLTFISEKRETKSGNAFFTQWTLETIIFSHSQSKRMWFSVHNGTHTSYDHIWDDSLKTARYTIRLFWSSSRSRRRFFFLKWKIITFISATCFEWNEMKIIRKESSNDIFFFTHLHFNHKCSDQFFLYSN